MMTREAAAARAEHHRQQYISTRFENVVVLERQLPYPYFIIKATKGPCAIHRTVRFAP